MSPLYTYQNKLLVRNNALATSKNCCCSESSSSSSSSSSCGCYKVDYIWSIGDCGGDIKEYSGSLLMSSGGIYCYNDAEVVSVTSTTLNYGITCDASLSIVCGISSTTITLTTNTLSDTAELSNNMCCGYVTSEFLTFDNQTLSLGVSFNNSGSCDCSGYTPV